jgi:hypothetical protein
MMILALRFRRAKQADHAVCIKGRRSATQGAFRKAGLLRSFELRGIPYRTTGLICSYNRCSGVRHHWISRW